MKLRTFNRYSFPEQDISCGTVAVALLTNQSPSNVKKKLDNLRRKQKWSPRKINSHNDYMYWDEAIELLGKKAKQTKTVVPRKAKSLKTINKFNRGTFLVCTTDHLQVIHDGLIYDTYENGCLWPTKIENHEWNRRKVICWKRVDAAK